MTNHVHLLLSADHADAGGALMKSLGQRYVQYVNRVYRELFRHELEPGLVDKIRRATNGNFALGSERFAAAVAEMIGRRASPGQSGRPRKSTVPESGKLRFE